MVRAAEAAGVSVQTARKWVRRYEIERPSSLEDRSSRPHNIRRKNVTVSANLQARVLAL